MALLDKYKTTAGGKRRPLGFEWDDINGEHQEAYSGVLPYLQDLEIEYNHLQCCLFINMLREAGFYNFRDWQWKNKRRAKFPKEMGMVHRFLFNLCASEGDAAVALQATKEGLRFTKRFQRTTKAHLSKAGYTFATYKCNGCGQARPMPHIRYHITICAEWAKLDDEASTLLFTKAIQQIEPSLDEILQKGELPWA